MTTLPHVLRSASVEGDVIETRLAGGGAVGVHALAVRDACPCADCRLPSGQRLFESHLLLPDVAAVRAQVDGGALVVRFSDGHETRLDPRALEALLGLAPRPPRELWGAELTHDLARRRHADVVDDADERRAWLRDVANLGVALLFGAPRRNDTVAEVAELFSPVRVTNYGRVFDVQVQVDAANLADSALPLSVHTDNCYRVPQPTLQLLHCLSSSASGGETILVDGFRALERLRDEDPDSLELLAVQPIRYAYADRTAVLESEVPVVELGDDGEPVALHLNNRSKGVPAGPPALARAWYEAYFRLWSLLDHPEAQARLRLVPGDVVVFDNWRVLHGRSGFTEAGARRLQGCYADRDALLSTLAVLERTEEER